MDRDKTQSQQDKRAGSSLLGAHTLAAMLPFVLITSCFALWGFANDITNPMVKAFSKIFRMSVTEGSLVQVAFYGGYFAMAFPAAMFIRRFSYKSGVLVGLGLYAGGAFMFYPAMLSGQYYPFLAAYFILTCGLSFLETSCNPYILAMGPSATATRRLNLAQAFNPIGSLAGMWVAMHYIQSRLNPLDSDGRALLDDNKFAAVRDSDLWVLVQPYLLLGLFILTMIVLIAVVKMPRGAGDDGAKVNLRGSLVRLMSNRRYREGVIAQFFYVGAQIMCWTFIIQYGSRIFMAEGMSETEAEVLSQRYNIAAMVAFCCGRFVCTWLLRFVDARRLLTVLAVAAAVLTAGVILCDGHAGLICLVSVSACMSLMFPTIYGLALEGVGDDAKIGAAGLVMSILGGSLLPPVQAAIIDSRADFGLPPVNLSFVLPLICFLAVALYGLRATKY